MIRELFKEYFNKHKYWCVLGFTLILACAVGQVFLLLGLNVWFKDFWEFVQAKDISNTLSNIPVFCGYAFGLIGVSTISVWLQQMWTLKFRASVTPIFERKLVELRGKIPTLSQRVTMDLPIVVANGVNLLCLFINAVLNVVLFATVIVSIGANIGYLGNPYLLLLLCVVVSIIGTSILYLVGHRLRKLNYNNEQTEATYRAYITDTETAGKVDKQHLAATRVSFNELMDNHTILYNAIKRVTFTQVSYSQVCIILPILIILPAFFTGHVNFGTIFQFSDAFGRFNTGLSFIPENFQDGSSWLASYKRLREIYNA